MTNSIFIGLIENIAVLLAFSMIYDYFWAKNIENRKTGGKVLAGFLIGLVAIFLMRIPWTLIPGIQFDSRSVLLSISGLFFGYIPTFIAMVIAAVYRIYLGGNGMWMGVAVILSSGFIGIVWGQVFPPKKIKQPHFNILFMGLVVHFTMMLCTFFLPRENIFDTMKVIALPLLLLYTPGTMLLGLLMIKRWAFWQQQKKSEEEESRYRKLFENAGEAILVAQEGYIVFANKRLSDILRRSYEEIRMKPFTEFIHPDDREFVMERHRERVKKHEVPKFYSFRILTTAGEVRWLEINSVYYVWNGEPASLGFLSDVTSLRETARQLVLAKEKAVNSDRLKTIFLSNMSHEIRTPMNAILGFSELLGNTETEPQKNNHYINMIRMAGNQLLHIINDIVDISKLEVNQLSINMKNCNLQEIFTESVEVFRNNQLLKDKKDVKLIFEFPDMCKDIRIIGDPFRIKQVIDNLLSNAIKYTEKGSITVSCKPAINDNMVHVETHIIDTGSGIPDDKKDIIFERFRQVEENTYREGAGLGLSIAKGIIQLMGGTIGFESQEGKGSDFYFTLDLERAFEPTGDKLEENRNIPNLKGNYVIVADDDITSYYLLKEFLSETKAEIAHAIDGEQLLSMMAERMPDLVLLDINMPKKDGYECLREIKKNNYSCKIIAQTAYAMENEKERCFRSGCLGYVAKPIDADILYAEIRQVMKKN